MTTPTRPDAATDAFYVEVRFDDCRRIIEFTGPGSEVFARTLIPEGDAPPEQVVADGDYEVSVDLESCGDQHSAIFHAMQVVTDDIRDDICWLEHWETGGVRVAPPEPFVDGDLL